MQCSPLPNSFAFPTAERALHNACKMKTSVTGLTLDNGLGVKWEDGVASTTVLTHKTLTPTELARTDVVYAGLMCLL